MSARLSIANSPYEYDITGNLPNSISRRSSGESSTNIGSVSALMQKTNLGSQSNLVVPPIPGAMTNTNNGNVNGMGNPIGFGNIVGNKYCNERLARYAFYQFINIYIYILIITLTILRKFYVLNTHKMWLSLTVRLNSYWLSHG